jgi:molecular chaperone HscB
MQARPVAAESPSPSEPHSHEDGEESCPSCWAHLSTPLFCESCEELLEPKQSPSPFATLGVQPEYALNRMALRKRLLSLSRHLHPDFFSNAEQTVRERAQRNTAELNAAFEILDDDFHRADWLVKSLGGPSEAEERQMPPAFLAEVLEWNETIEEAKDAEPDTPERAALDPLETSLREQRKELMNLISAKLDPLPEAHDPILAQARRNLNAIRYVDRSLREISEIRLAQPSES